MRVGGINWVAALVAAIAIYAVGFIIYGLLIQPEQWMAMSGLTKEQMDAVGMSRMIYSPMMPILTAVFLAVLFKWGAVDSAAKGARWATVVALASAIPALWYGWVYGVGPASGTLLDSGHLLAGHIIAGAILGGWR